MVDYEAFCEAQCNTVDSELQPTKKKTKFYAYVISQKTKHKINKNINSMMLFMS